MTTEEKLEAAEDGLRHIAFYLGCGGYNSDSVDVEQFVKKIKEEIDFHAQWCYQLGAEQKIKNEDKHL